MTILTTTDKASSEFEDLKVDIDNRIAILSINRPPVNAFRTQTYEEVARALHLLDTDPTSVVLVVRSGNERCFSAGADLHELPMPPDKDELRQALVRRVLDQVLHATKPVICVVDGPALGGGCAITAAADIRVASERAYFGLPEITVGRGGGARHLMRVLPQGTVRLAYFTGKPLSAFEAHRLGMVQVLTPATPGAADAAAMEIARSIASHSPLALRYAKEALDLAEPMSISEGYHVEQQFTLRLATSNDASEAARAFAEHRPPAWTGK